MTLTQADIARHGGDAIGSADHLTDRDIANALCAESILLACCKLLTERHGRVVMRADLAARVAASTWLQRAQALGQLAWEQRAIKRAREIAERE